MTHNNITTFIGITFPSEWIWSKYEQQCIDSIQQQVKIKYPTSNNLIINLTWFGPQFNNHPGWEQYTDLVSNNCTFDNLFIISTVDPAMINPEQIEQIVKSLGNPRLFKIGNFDTAYHFNFFAPILKDLFRQYTEEEVLLVDPKWIYINYNRKPREHRVGLVKKLYERKLDHCGLITLGKPNVIYDNDPGNHLYLSLGEDSKDYVDYGHWYHDEDEFGIPHDVLSLHKMDHWQHHFLNIIGATEFNVWDDIFISETQFKPIIGLRPFIINGNVRTYKWLTDRGFKTFNHWFPGIDLEDPDLVHESICQVIEQLSQMPANQLNSLYQDMLPDLRHNKKLFFEFAEGERHRVNYIL